ncbi:hypothetical protein GUITHDRAFT_147529 [Guillardia theta CCMP2712]|uniref:Hflx-type G domain-containing protein n=1 Tax=Guillardia theta (strain CCMP2712) TaxID=905079 RepID=L1IDN1_GUITC|nr:hypothetical protein GUITHDRAFT_147529 [Guillardia theta CCMP2712]EKX34019.1 hypothetical protein GUITHDRAFT_147529 [Guillardia theta CCMP2712]|eukprot:XP_005820999.1 hypothetical protein GUITHDRAFT_147529 [Guillardia theta CCMP2712]
MPGMISFALLWSMVMSVGHVHAFTLIPGPHCLSKRGRWSDGPKRFSSLNMNLFGSETITTKKGDRAYIVGADIKRNRYKTLESSWEVDDSLDELQRLCETAGLVVLGREFQSMQNPSPSTFIGAGKVEALAKTVKTLEIDVVVFDDELSPAQGRNIQTILGEDVRVLDRTMLILQIFAQRARTREAKLQVQAAQMKYMMPRLQYFMTEGAGMEARGGGGGGGKNLKGMGESQIEADKRLFRKQVGEEEDEAELQNVEKEMEEVKQQREVYRTKRRERDNLPIIAIVGYTNAGKSTMLNKLCGSEEVYADDLLFATLDPTTRKLRVQNIIEELMLEDTPQEKIESPAWLRIHERVIPECTVATSAKSGDGLAELLDIVEEALLQLSVMIECLLPYSASDLLAEIHKVGTIIQEDFQESGTRVVAYVPPSLRNKLGEEEVGKQGRIGQNRTEQGRTREDRTGMDRISKDRTGQDK